MNGVVGVGCLDIPGDDEKEQRREGSSEDS